MNLLFFDDHNRNQLLPLTFTKPVSELRTGILTIREKWEKHLDSEGSWITEEYLSSKYPSRPGEDNLYILGGLLPDSSVIRTIKKLNPNDSLWFDNRLIAFRMGSEGEDFLKNPDQTGNFRKIIIEEADILDFPWQVFSKNGEQIQRDFDLITSGRKSASLSGSNRCLGNNIFLEDGVRVEMATINSESGPVYLGKDSEIMEGSIIRGPFALCESSVVKMGAKIYGPTTIGPHSKAGGEINNSVFQAYSNKGHDGFLGNSVIGEWCNLGADTNNSNLKNNYAEVRLWSYITESYVKTGLQFCGLIMGDHSKCGINTMFNTGTVVGVNANIFGSGFQNNFIPSFSWGGAPKFIVYKPDKAFEVAEKVMKRRKVNLDKKDKDILSEVFKMTEKYRK